MNTLATIPQHQLSAHSAEAFLSAEKLRMLGDTIMKGALPEEIEFFGEVCKRTSLDPFRKQIHAVSRWDSILKRKVWSFQTGIDGFRAIASRNKLCAGIDDAIFEPKDENAEFPVKATVTVWKFVNGQRIPFTATARWREYVQTDKDGKIISMWRKMPYGQLAKCAEALALRKAFPEDLSGLHTDEEMQQAENPLPPERSAYRLDELDEEPKTPPVDPAPAKSKVIDVPSEPVASKLPQLAVPEGIEGFTGGRWRSAPMAEGGTLGGLKQPALLRLRQQLPEPLRDPLLATYIDQILSLLPPVNMTEDEFAAVAYERKEFDLAFEQDLWLAPQHYPAFLELAKSLTP